MFLKKIAVFLLFLFLQLSHAQFIRVNDASDAQTSFSSEDLIKKVLIGCSSANISNIQISKQPSIAANRSYGYFNQNSTKFPFKEGIVISTGFAKNIGNSLSSNILDDNLGNGGDADLSAAIGAQTLVDASFIEFDFIPVSDKISFNYIFASEEYNAKPCDYDDGFALLLKKYNSNGTSSSYINLAVLPNGDPVKVTKIHSSKTYNGSNLSCGAVNEAYFGGYNPAPNTVTNFDGYVVPLKAEATVIPGEKYHLKIIVADEQNYRYDSAVFLEAGSFNSSVYITGNTVLCGGSPTVLTANTAGSATYQWSKNGVPLSGETNRTLSASSAGNYSITISTSDGCNSTANIAVTETKINILPPPKLDCKNATIFLDATNSQYSRKATFLWTTTDGHIAGFGDTPAPDVDKAGTYTLKLTDGNCVLTESVTVTENKILPVIALSADKLKVCKGDAVVLTASGADSYNWNSSAATSGSITVNPTQTTTYSVSGIGSNGCISLPKNITIEVVPEITSTLSDAKTCNGDVITLEAGANSAYTYQWFFNGNLLQGKTAHNISVSQIGNYKVVISNGICSKEFTANVSQPPLPAITNVDYQNNQIIITASGSGNLEYLLKDGNTVVGWQNSNVFNQIKANTNYQIEIRLKGTSCFSSLDYFTLSVPNVISPNGDGINDRLDFSGISSFENFSFKIFDRFGKEVYSGNSANPFWDGKSSHRILPSGTYWYLLKWSISGTEKIKTGWIALKNY